MQLFHSFIGICSESKMTTQLVLKKVKQVTIWC